MTFAEYIERLANGIPLSAGEKQDLVLQARRLDDAASLLNDLIRPGTRLLRIDGLETNNAVIAHAEITDAIILSAQAGDVRLDSFGLFVEYDSTYGITFGDSGGGNRIRIVSSSGDQLQFQNEVGDFEFVRTLTDSTTPTFSYGEDSTANRTLLSLAAGVQGARFAVAGNTGGGAEDLIEFRTQGSAAGSTFLRMRETTVTPTSPGTSDSMHVYIKSDKLVIQYNDAGTVRYKYLDLTGTGVTWIHTTSAP